jgi:hypothetical protein
VTPDDILAQLPNGMHDASIREMRVQFGRQFVTLDMDFWVGDLDSEDEGKREAYRAGKLLLAGLTAMVVEPPDPADRGSQFSPNEAWTCTGSLERTRATRQRRRTASCASGSTSRTGTRG